MFTLRNLTTSLSLQRDTSQALLQIQTKQWLAAHDKRLPLPPLSPKVLAFIKEWYYLVDTDGSGELSLDEVAAAMQVTCFTFSLFAFACTPELTSPSIPTDARSGVDTCSVFLRMHYVLQSSPGY